MTSQPDVTPDAQQPIDEFADYDGDMVPFHADFAWSRLINPATLRGLASLVGGLVFLFSNRSTEATAVILAIVVAIWAVVEFLAPEERGRPKQLLTALALAALAVALLVWPNVTGTAVSRLLGGLVLFTGLRDLVTVVRSRPQGAISVWGLIRALFAIAVAAALWLVPGVMLSLFITVIALFWIITGVATLFANFTAAAEDVVDVTDIWPRIFNWLEDRPHTADDRTQLYGKLFYEGRLAARRMSRFFLLMGFATVIAAFGIISDSTAVVIGAMLVAPLMTPLMGTSLSLVMGWPRRASMSAGVALGGVILAVVLSAIAGGILSWELDPATNSQIASRITPNLIDMIIAIAAGGAGAFALSRPDVSDALPGVAVAIALVPPLAVAGLMIEAGDGSSAFGALLLFATNMVAILLVGAVVFLLTGVVPISNLVTRRVWIRNATTLIGILALGVLVILGITSEGLKTQAFDRTGVEEVIDEWIEDQPLQLVSLTVSPDEVEIVVVGADQPIEVEPLGTSIERRLRRDVVTTVRWVFEERFQTEGSD